MNIKYKDSEGFTRILIGASYLYVSIDKKPDYSIKGYEICCCSNDIIRTIFFFTEREKAGRFVDKFYESIANCNDPMEIIDLDKIKKEVDNEY